MIKKIGAAALILLLTLTICGVYIYDEKVNNASVESADEIEQEAAALRHKKQNLRSELSKLEDEHESVINGTGAAEILFTSFNAEIYDIFSVLSENGYSACIAASKTSRPGLDGCLTTAQTSELVAAGWEICAVYDDSLADTLNYLSSYGFSPTCVYFPSGEYSSEKLGTLPNTINTVVMHSEDGSYSTVPEMLENGIWKIGAMMWMDVTAPDVIGMIASDGGNIVFSVSFDETSTDMYEASQFSEMLNEIEGYDGKVAITTISNSRQAYVEINDPNSDEASEYEAKCNELSAEISAIDAKIDELYK